MSDIENYLRKSLKMLYDDLLDAENGPDRQTFGFKNRLKVLYEDLQELESKICAEFGLGYFGVLNDFEGEHYRRGDSGLDQLLKSQIKRLAIEIDANLDLNVESVSKPQKSIGKIKVFVVHGRELQPRDELKEILEKEFNLEPVILMDQANGGKTLIEKFENNTLEVNYAFVILTPDDYGHLNDRPFAKTEPRARQNVILELGYFVGKIGRDKVCCIRKGEKSLFPSDLHGLVDIPFKNSVKEIIPDIRKELLLSKII